MTTVCVVGAGPAGLVATKTLVQAGLEVDCFELSSVVGGQWVIDNPSGRSAAYRSLELNTTRAMSRLSDYEMPGDWPDFASHAQMREWLESYVDTFGFRDRIHVETEVTLAEPLEPSGWRVRVRGPGPEDGQPEGKEEERRYDALLACSGNYWSPRLPEIPGAFAGECIHAQSYRDPEHPLSLRGKRVVVVGIGNTGCELSCEIAKAGAASVRLSARSGTWILPKRRDGRPAAEGAPMMHPQDPVPALLTHLPDAVRRRLFARMATTMFGRTFGPRMKRFAELGLPPAPANPLDKRPTVCDPLMEALESGAVVARPAIERFEGNVVGYADGTREDADVIVFATGYHLRYPYLPESLVDTRADDLSLFLGTLHPERHDLFILGVSRPTGSFWPIAEVQARFAAALLSGAYRLPGKRGVRAKTRPILGGQSFNPALYGLAVREEISRGARRAR